MAKKAPENKKLVTPFRISVALNIVLGLIVVTVIGAAGFAYHEYKNGTKNALSFALAFNSFDYFCQQADENVDQWVAERITDEEEPFTAEDAKRAKLLIESQCIDPKFEPYYTKAQKQFFKDNGLTFEP